VPIPRLNLSRHSITCFEGSKGQNRDVGENEREVKEASGEPKCCTYMQECMLEHKVIWGHMVKW